MGFERKNHRKDIKKAVTFDYNCLIFSGATSNRKSVCIALFLNKLYLYYDVSPLNKVFTTLHRSTQFCVLGSISACKGRYLFGIINISKKFFWHLVYFQILHYLFGKRKQEYYLLNNRYLQEVYRIMGNDIETSVFL